MEKNHQLENKKNESSCAFDAGLLVEKFGNAGLMQALGGNGKFGNAGLMQALRGNWKFRNVGLMQALGGKGEIWKRGSDAGPGGETGNLETRV